MTGRIGRSTRSALFGTGARIGPFLEIRAMQSGCHENTVLNLANEASRPRTLVSAPRFQIPEITIPTVHVRSVVLPYPSV